MEGLVKKSTLLPKIQKLREFIDNLESLQKEFKNREKFLKDFKQQYALSKAVEFCTESIKDISYTLLKIYSIRSKKFKSLEEALSQLHKKGILSAGFPKLIQDWIEFRNKLVHDYLGFDAKTLFDHNHENLRFFKLFLKEVVNYLDVH